MAVDVYFINDKFESIDDFKVTGGKHLTRTKNKKGLTFMDYLDINITEHEPKSYEIYEEYSRPSDENIQRLKEDFDDETILKVVNYLELNKNVHIGFTF